MVRADSGAQSVDAPLWLGRAAERADYRRRVDRVRGRGIRRAHRRVHAMVARGLCGGGHAASCALPFLRDGAPSAGGGDDCVVDAAADAVWWCAVGGCDARARGGESKARAVRAEGYGGDESRCALAPARGAVAARARVSLRRAVEGHARQGRLDERLHDVVLLIARRHRQFDSAEPCARARALGRHRGGGARAGIRD